MIDDRIAFTFKKVEEHAALNQWSVLGFYFANEGLGESVSDPAKANTPILIKRLVAQVGPEVSFFAVRSVHHKPHNEAC